jgi:hypothetical protein
VSGHSQSYACAGVSDYRPEGAVRDGGPKVLDYSEVNWEQEKPTQADLNTDWARVRVRDAGSADPRLTAVVEGLRRSHDNGGAMLGRFSIEAPPSWRWYLSRNRFDEAQFFRRFYQHPTVIQTLGPLGSLSPITGDLGFTMEQPHVATGRLAGTLASGGAYTPFNGTDKELLRLVSSFTEAAFDDRYSDIFAYVSFAPWSSWFKDVAWDASFFWFDKKTGVATTLLVTDTD